MFKNKFLALKDLSSDLRIPNNIVVPLNFAALLGAITFCLLALANESIRPLAVRELPGRVTKDLFVRVPGCEVAYVNEIALRRDFPQLNNLSRGEIENWVLDNFAYVSEAQLKLSNIRNSEIPTEAIPKTKEAFRPDGYGRAAVKNQHLFWL